MALERISALTDGLSPESREKLEMFHVELLRFNRAINLISSNTIQNADFVHVADGILSYLEYSKLNRLSEASQIYDLGSGNGIPGVIWSILDSHGSIYHLIESDTRKADFLRWVVTKMESKNIMVEMVRAETLDIVHPARFLSRGFASISEILHLVDRISNTGSIEVIALKGRSAETEWKACTDLQRSTWNTPIIINYELPHQFGQRILAVINKKD